MCGLVQKSDSLMTCSVGELKTQVSGRVRVERERVADTIIFMPTIVAEEDRRCNE